MFIKACQAGVEGNTFSHFFPLTYCQSIPLREPTGIQRTREANGYKHTLSRTQAREQAVPIGGEWMLRGNQGMQDVVSVRPIFCFRDIEMEKKCFNVLSTLNEIW